MINFTGSYNFSNNTEYLNTVLGTPSAYPRECFINGKYSLECLHATICPQFTDYFIRTGIIIILFYILLSWLLWWYFKFGYLKFKPPADNFFGDMMNIETRIYWDTWIRARISNLMIGFIAAVVWLSINRNI